MHYVERRNGKVQEIMWKFKARHIKIAEIEGESRPSTKIVKIAILWEEVHLNVPRYDEETPHQLQWELDWEDDNSGGLESGQVPRQEGFEIRDYPPQHNWKKWLS